MRFVQPARAAGYGVAPMTAGRTAGLAAGLLAGHAAAVIDAAREAGPATAEAVSQLAAVELEAHAVSNSIVIEPADVDWARCQEAFLRFAAVDGADARVLASGLLGAMVQQVCVSADGPVPDAAVAQWIAATVPELLQRVLAAEAEHGAHELRSTGVLRALRAAL